MSLIQLNSKVVVELECFITAHFHENVWRVGFFEGPETKPEYAGLALTTRLL